MKQHQRPSTKNLAHDRRVARHLVVFAFVAMAFFYIVAPDAMKFGVTAEMKPADHATPSPAVASDAPSKEGEQARQQVIDILSRPEFSRWKPQPPEPEVKSVDGSISDRVWELLKTCGKGLADFWDYVWRPIGDFFQKLWDWFKKLWPASSPTSPAGPIGNPGSGWNIDYGAVLRVVGWTLLAIIVIVLAVLIFKRVRTGPRQGRSARVLSREQVRSALETGEALALEGHEWVEQAEKLLAEKDLRAVYRALYLGMLAGLHSAGKIDFRQTRTNWFYVRRFKGDDTDRGVFGELTELFDEVWYGNRTGRIEEVSRVKAKVVSLVGREALTSLRSEPKGDAK